MTSPEIKTSPVSPSEIYAATVAEFEKRRKEILASTSAPVSNPSFWRKLFRATSQPTPTGPSVEEQLAALGAEFSSWLHSDRRLVVCHLKANPDKQEEIITSYLQSPELLKDSDTLGQFFAFWLREFLQKADTGPLENFLNFIKASPKESLPPELHQARREIFEPLFAFLNGKEKEIFEKVKEIGLFGVGHQLAKSLIEADQPLPNGLKKEYQNYVDRLIKIEAGIVSVGPAEPEPKEPKGKPKRNKRLPSPEKPKTRKETPPQPETFPSVETNACYSFWIVLGPNKDPSEIKNLEELARAMKKIKGLGPITAEDVWKTLQEIISTPPLQRMERYGERVVGGPFEGWWKANLGGKYRLIFWIKNNELHFRVGPDESVYATRRRKPPDRARSL